MPIATVDPEDYEWLNGFRWHATCSRGQYYAATVVNGKSISMHRMIMNPPPGMQVDHKSKDRLNNHRYNLRLATARQNRYNTGPVKRKDRPKSSQFVGVMRHGDRWKVKITHEGKEYYLGLFDDEIEAALAWDAKARELHGEFAYLNFPDEFAGNGKADSQQGPSETSTNTNSKKKRPSAKRPRRRIVNLSGTAVIHTSARGRLSITESSPEKS